MTKSLDSDAKTFGDWAGVAIAKHFHKILKHETAVLEDSDPEELHQMRVGMRRLRSAIAGFSLALDLPKEAQEKNIAKLARTLGNLRDIDVLQEILNTQYKPALPTSEQVELDRILEIFQKQRKAALKQVKKTLKGEIYLKFKKAITIWLDNPQYQEIAAILMHPILPDLLLPQVSKLFLHPGWLVGGQFQDGKIELINGISEEQVEKILESQGKILHGLRKEAKRSRYNLELFTQFYSDNYQEYIQDIKAVQTILGDLQDALVLKEFMISCVDRDILEKIPNFSQILLKQQHQRWQQWTELQGKFLNPQNRQEFHLTLIKPLITDSLHG